MTIAIVVILVAIIIGLLSYNLSIHKKIQTYSNKPIIIATSITTIAIVNFIPPFKISFSFCLKYYSYLKKNYFDIDLAHIYYSFHLLKDIYYFLFALNIA